MTFNSLAFLVFAALFFAVWPLVSRRDVLRWTWITAGSFLFYGWWDWRYCFLLAANGLSDYVIAWRIQRSEKWRKLLLVVSVVVNVGTLAVFKYGGFLAVSVNRVLSLLGDQRVPVPSLVLPIGISFYTFHSLSYIFDVYRGAAVPAKNPLHFLAYLTLFPHLVAGPIIRAADTLPQLATYHPPSEEDRFQGMWLIAKGFAKKTVIADNLAPVVWMAFASSPASASAPYWWVVMACFSMQIYGDFAGYSDIARGLARWVGVRFPLNFNHPYASASIREFWTRWHMSLSSWFRDYVYIPLGGSRRGPARSMMALWATMILSGLWHGAAWHFVVWGALHAAFVSVERLTRWPDRIPRGLAVGVTFVQVCFAWVLFRADSLGQAIRISVAMFNPLGWDWVLPRGLTMPVGIILVAALLRELWILGGLRIRVPLWSERVMPLGAAALLVLAIFMRGPGTTFIYFQF